MAIFSKKDDSNEEYPLVKATTAKQVDASVKLVAHDDFSVVDYNTPQVVLSDRAIDASGFNNPDVATIPVINTEDEQLEINGINIYSTAPREVRNSVIESTEADIKRVVYTLDKDGNEISDRPVIKIDPSEYISDNKITEISRPSISDFNSLPTTPTIKSELNSPALRDSLGDLGSYIWSTPSVSEILDNMGSKLGLGKLSDDYNEFVYGAKLVKQIHDETGDSYLKSAVRALNRTTAAMVKSDVAVPLLNSLLNNIPVISFFTKSKYSLAKNKKTYAHEADYETKRTWLASIRSLASSGVCGLYYNATFYSNHNIPKDKVEGIIRKLAGDPSASAPNPKILDEESKMYAYTYINGVKTIINPDAQYTGTDPRGVGNKLSSFKNVFTQKTHNFDDKSKRISATDYTVKSQNEILNIESQRSKPIPENGTGASFGSDESTVNGPYSGNEFGVAGKFLSGRPLKSSKINPGIIKYWKNFVTQSAESSASTITTSVSGFSYYNPPTDFKELSYIEPINTISDYVDYQTNLYDQMAADSKVTVSKNDIRYGMLPYNWAQVFKGFEISSNGNWNVSLCEFDDSASKFVPKGRPTYGTWSYMPIMSYEYADKELQTSSIEVSQSLNLMIPSANTYVSTLQLTFLDDRFDRIYNWFSLYVNNIYGVYDGYAKPYKNSCLKITIDILDWDRTILKRLRVAALPINFTQQYSGDSNDSYKTVSVTFSVVGEVYNEKTRKPVGRHRPIESELLELEKIMASVDRSAKVR